MRPVDPSRLDLAREFKHKPLGPHSAELEDLLRIMRWAPAVDRYIAVQVERGGPWCVGLTTGPKGTPVQLYREVEYGDVASAHWAVFRKRWERLTGCALALDDDDAVDPTAGIATPSTGLCRRPLLGYADRFSVAHGETIGFKVSATQGGPYDAEIVRLRCGDHANIGLRYAPVQVPANGQYPGRVQAIAAGSYVAFGADVQPHFGLASFTLAVTVWPTAPGRGEQALLGSFDALAGLGYALLLDADGAPALRIGDGQRVQTVTTGVPLRERHWYHTVATFDAATGSAWIGQRAHLDYALAPSVTEACAQLALADWPPRRTPQPPFRIAAWSAAPRARAAAHYNGKLEAPLVACKAVAEHQRPAMLSCPTAPENVRGLGADLVACWDFSRHIDGTRVEDRSANGRHGEVVNLPTRAMKGSAWDGSEYNWQHRPEHYAAIHFHDDDLYDCGWQTDFELAVDTTLASGLYCARLTQGEHGDWIPFVVRPPTGTANAPLALVLPSASYWAYANRHTVIDFRGREHVRAAFSTVDATALYLHDHPELGLSMYDEHSDGSGVCYSSRLRPILSMRPDEGLWQLPADTHIIDWLEAQGIAHDIITEDDLDRHGEALLAPYRCVLTGTHPEYPSRAMLDAFAAFQAGGGRFIYFGGNGFYWRVSYSANLPGVMEHRRAEDGIRAWEAEGGEYYHATTGELGGMWRRMGRPPQSVAGTGMTAQGFDRSTYYTRTRASFDPRAEFIFAGVGADERIGDFGILGGGAAGWEIDRADPALGTPPHALVVATADTFGSGYHWMKEELTHTHAAITGLNCPHVHCDMVFYETPGGGGVFSTSSIAWAGALAHNGYANNVSRISANVIERFLDPRPLSAAVQPFV